MAYAYSDDYLTVEEAAERLGVDPVFVLGLVHDGSLPVAVGLGVRGYSVWRQAVEQLAAGPRAEATTRPGRRQLVTA